MENNTENLTIWTEFFQGEATGILGLTAMVIALALVCITAIAIAWRR